MHLKSVTVGTLRMTAMFLAGLQLLIVVLFLESRTVQGDRFAAIITPAALFSLLILSFSERRSTTRAVQVVNCGLCMLFGICWLLLQFGVLDWLYIGFDTFVAATFCSLLACAIPVALSTIATAMLRRL